MQVSNTKTDVGVLFIRNRIIAIAAAAQKRERPSLSPDESPSLGFNSGGSWLGLLRMPQAYQKSLRICIFTVKRM